MRDDKFGTAFDVPARASGIRVIRTAVRARDMNAICERFLGSLRRECLDHVLVIDDRHSPASSCVAGHAPTPYPRPAIGTQPACATRPERGTVATTISLINMKGGVGKTTLATQLAWHAVYSLDKKALVVDLDPQANASQAVMTPATYVKWLDDGNPTVVEVLEEFTPTGSASNSPKKLDPKKVVYRRIKYPDGSLLDLVPSRLELSWSLRNPSGKENLLARFISKIEEDYDFIFIDCAPTDSMLTDAAYMSSRFILVPMRAEFLAAIGFPLLSRSVEAFKIRHENHKIDICGLVFTDYRKNRREDRLARSDVEANARKYKWHIFESEVPHSDSYPRSAREGMPIARTKGAHAKTKDDFTAFANEFFERISE